MLKSLHIVKNCIWLLQPQIQNPMGRDESRPPLMRCGQYPSVWQKFSSISRAQKEVFDPFCGTGTILQEALLMGYKAKGSDKQVQDARKIFLGLKAVSCSKGEWQ